MAEQHDKQDTGSLHENTAALRRVPVRMSVLQTCTILLAAVLAVVVLVTQRSVVKAQGDVSQMNLAYRECQSAADELQLVSDYLTNEARSYVASGERIYLESYLVEVFKSDRRGAALEALHAHATSDEAVHELELASQYSDELARTELYALHLAALAYGIEDIPDALAQAELSSEDLALPSDAKLLHANELVNGSNYESKKLAISEQVQSCSKILVDTLGEELRRENERVSSLVVQMRVGVILLLLVVVFFIFSVSVWVMWPMALNAKSIMASEPLEVSGAKELRVLAEAYNEMYAKNHLMTESLSFEAHNDALTGVLNRGSFDVLLTKYKTNSALILVDVDNFKAFNDSHGHEMGDAILIEVSATLYASFRSTDFVCRIGGDEFAVIMVGATSDQRKIIEHKLDKGAAFLRDGSNGLPAATVSVGVAFGGPNCNDQELFQAADAALYETKRRGRDGYTFAE